MQKLRIAMCFDAFGPYHLARLNKLNEEFPTLGLEVKSKSETYQWLADRSENSFARVTLLDEADAGSASFKSLNDKIFSALDNWLPDVVFIPGWATPASFALLSWCQRRKIPSVVMSDSTQRDKDRQGLREFIKRCIVGCHNAAFVAGSRQKAYVKQLGMPESAISLGYDVVDNEYFAKGAHIARSRPDQRTHHKLPGRFILASSRFVKIKNLIRLLEGWSIFLKSCPVKDIYLVLLGDGPEKGELEQHAKRLGVTNRVIFPGFKQYDVLPVYYGLAEAFIHVPMVEPWGLVVNEAMSSSLPVIVSRASGCSDDLVIDGQNGLLVDHDDPFSIACALTRLNEGGGPRRRLMGQKSLTIISDFSLQRFTDGAREAAMIALNRQPELSTVGRQLVSSSFKLKEVLDK